MPRCRCPMCSSTAKLGGRPRAMRSAWSSAYVVPYARGQRPWRWRSAARNASRADVRIFSIEVHRLPQRRASARAGSAWPTRSSVLDPFASRALMVGTCAATSDLELEISRVTTISGLATANTLAALQAPAPRHARGDGRIGLGERAGNAPLEEVAVAVSGSFTGVRPASTCGPYVGNVAQRGRRRPRGAPFRAGEGDRGRCTSSRTGSPASMSMGLLKDQQAPTRRSTRRCSGARHRLVHRQAFGPLGARRPCVQGFTSAGDVHLDEARGDPRSASALMRCATKGSRACQYAADRLQRDGRPWHAKPAARASALRPSCANEDTAAMSDAVATACELSLWRTSSLVLLRCWV